jgi:hypothetical protein
MFEYPVARDCDEFAAHANDSDWLIACILRLWLRLIFSVSPVSSTLRVRPASLPLPLD